MPNHVHLIAVPRSEDGLAQAVGEAHRRYTRRINFRQKWRGYLWQGRFASLVMDEPYLLAAARYVALNPVRAGLAADASDWRGLLNSALREEELRDMRAHARTGCPLGDAPFLARLEQAIGRSLRPAKPGRPPKLLKRP